MPITALYASLLAILFLVLSARTITYRRAKRVEIGDGEDRELLRRIRVHANCAEYAPIALLLIGFAESLAAPPVLLHALGGALLVGRVMHAWGLSQTPHHIGARVGGMAATLTVIGFAAAAALVLALPRLV